MKSYIQIIVTGLDEKSRIQWIPKQASVGFLVDSISQHTSEGGLGDEARVLYGARELRSGSSERIGTLGIGDLSSLTVTAPLRAGYNEFETESDDKDKDLVKAVYERVLQPLPGHVSLVKEGTCMITLDDDVPVAKMTCGHLISPRGMTQYCKSILDSQRCVFPCPYVDDYGDDRCGTIWELFVVKHVAVLSQAELREFQGRLAENYARRHLGVQECPGCESLCMRNDVNDVIVRCLVCSGSYDFCWNCLHRAYSSECQNSECDGRDPRARVLEKCERKRIGEVPDCPSMRACVECGILIEHTEACKHMTCTNCNAQFCFICLQQQDEEGDWPCGGYDEPCTPAPVQCNAKGY